MKRRKNKKSGIIAAVVGLSAVSLVSVGFASWVMSGGDTAEIDGSISVETVQDKRYLIAGGTHAPSIDYGENANGETDKKFICFGIDDTPAISGAWLTASSTVADNKYENLDATLTFYVANLEKSQAHANVPHATLSVTGNTTGWTDAVTKTYVAAAPTTLTCAIGDDTFEDTEAKLTYRKVTAAINFGWGARFNYDDDPEDETPEAPVNPYVYFNKTMDNSIANTTTAKAILDELAKDLAGVTFKVTITTIVPNNA